MLFQTSSCCGAARAASALDAAAALRCLAAAPQQFLNFCLQPHGQGLLRGGCFCSPSRFFFPSAPSSAFLRNSESLGDC